MNFDVRIQALDKLFEINNDVAAYWSKADQLLEEMEHATEGVTGRTISPRAALLKLLSDSHSRPHADWSINTAHSRDMLPRSPTGGTRP